MLKSLLLSFSLLLLFPVFATASESLVLTVYQGGTALVNDVRSFELESGTGETAVSGLPETMRFGSLLVRSVTAPKDFRIVFTRFHSGGLSSADVLRRNIGNTLKFVLPGEHEADSRRVVKARLLGIEGGHALLEMDDGGMWIGPYEAVMLDSTPKDAVLAPLLTWKYSNKGPKKQDVALSYLADGLDWDAEMVLTDHGGRFSMGAWATIENRSGNRFEDARVMLVAGEVRTGRPTAPVMRNKAFAVEMDMAAAPMPERSSFGQWHLYDAGKGYTLPTGASTRIALFEVDDMPVTRWLYARNNVGLSPRRDVEQRPLNIKLKLENRGTGQPIPSGVVRVYEPGPNGGSLFAGETNIGNVPEKGKATLDVGRAFDVTMDRRQTEYRKTGKRSYVVAYEVTLNNARDDAADVVLDERVPGEWEITSSNIKPEKKDSATMRYSLKVPGKGKAVVTYRLEVELQ